MKPARKTPSECPVCGADVPSTAMACPSCGADERTGWDEDATRYDGLDLPEHAFRDDSDEPAAQRARPRPRINGIPAVWWLLAVLLLALMIGAALGLG